MDDTNKFFNSNSEITAKDKATLFKGIVTCMLIFMNYIVANDIFMIIFLISSILLILFSDMHSSTIYLLMFTPFSEIIKISFSGIYFYFIIFFSYIFSCYVLKINKISKKILFIFFILTIYIILTYDYSDNSRYVQSVIVIVSYFALIPLLQTYKKEKFDFYVLAFSLSFILSSILGFLRPILPKLDAVLRVNKVWIGMDSFDRFMGVSWDTNIYALFCLLIITLILNTNFRTRKKLFLIGTVLYFGLLTFSKMYLLSLVIILFLYFILEIKANIFKASMILLVLVLSFFAIEFFTDGYINQMFAFRFAGDGVSALTTGRSDLQKMYLDEITSNPKIFLIGSSFGNPNLNERASHNTFIQMFYNLGIIGFVIFTIYIAMLHNLIRKHTKKFRIGINIAPLVICSFTLMALSMFTNHTMYVVIFFCIISLNNFKNGGSYVRKN